MRRHITTRTALALISVTSCIVLGGCGGDDDDTPAAASTGTTRTPSTQASATPTAATPTSVTVGTAAVDSSDAGAPASRGLPTDCVTPAEVGDTVGVELELDPVSVTE